MLRSLNSCALLALLSSLARVGVFAKPTAALVAAKVALTLPPLITEVVTTTTTYPASTPTTYTSSAYDVDCDCYYSTIYWWTPHPYPHYSYQTSSSSSSAPATTTITVTSTTEVPTTTTVTATATVTQPCTPTLTCDKYGYPIQNVTLFQVDLSTGRFTTIADHLGENTGLNAIAYNPLDNFLYAHEGASYRVLRIGSDGTTTPVATLERTRPINVGDIDSEGYYWYGSEGEIWHQLDLGRMDSLGLTIADWLYIPVAGPYLYTAARVPGGGAALARFSLETKTWQIVQRYPNLRGGLFGAVYGINNGTLYASDNADGRLWAFNVNGGAPYVASQGPVSPGLNDGARLPVPYLGVYVRWAHACPLGSQLGVVCLDIFFNDLILPNLRVKDAHIGLGIRLAL
ncbi:hypothetical protein GGS20DRAFT_579526 [Poronia punctata]|nr:hypothetical protein GGS20DRAFT_579526 [Poronia punctata]